VAVEHETERREPRLAYYRRDVLTPLPKARLIEYDRENEVAILSPTGAVEVEKRVLPKVDLNSL
jgi:hypothetical protein